MNKIKKKKYGVNIFPGSQPNGKGPPPLLPPCTFWAQQGLKPLPRTSLPSFPHTYKHNLTARFSQAQVTQKLQKMSWVLQIPTNLYLKNGNKRIETIRYARYMSSLKGIISSSSFKAFPWGRCVYQITKICNYNGVHWTSWCRRKRLLTHISCSKAWK